MDLKEKLDNIHEDVPVDYYQQGIKKNIFQRFWHLRRFALISKEMKTLNLSGPILDLGCHSGDLTNIIKQATNCQLHGLDISKQSIDYAKRRFKDIQFLAGNFSQTIPFPNDTFVVVTAFDVLEHVVDIFKILAEIKRVLKPGGYFIIGIPNENILFKVVWFFWLKFKGRVWQGVHIHDFKAEGFAVFKKQDFFKIKEKKIILNMWRFVIFKVKK